MKCLDSTWIQMNADLQNYTFLCHAFCCGRSHSVDIVRRDAAVVASLAEAGLEVGHSLQLETRVEVWDYTVYWEAYRQREYHREKD
jgi:hypothetical protein